MEAAGVAFAAFSLFNELQKCGRSLHRFSRDIRMAKEEVKMLKLEVNNCQVLASIFEEAIKPVKSRVMQLAKEHDLEKSLGEQSSLAHEQIRTITRKLGPLHRGKATGFEKLQAKIRWHFTKGDIGSPIAVLQNVKASLTLLSSLAILDRGVADAAQNRSSDPTALSQAIKRIGALEKQFRRTLREFRKSNQVLHEHNYLDGRPQTASNIQGITDIIDEIKKRPLRDARDLRQSLSSQREFVLKSNPDLLSRSTSPVNDGVAFIQRDINRSHGSPNAQYEIQLTRRHHSTRSRNFTHEHSRSSARNYTPVDSEHVPRGTVGNHSPVSLGHDDREVIEVEIERTASHASGDIYQDNLHAPTTPGSIYQPMPPFNTSDLQERSQRRHRRPGNSPSGDKG